ncbi:dephospho-CoA kinase [Candidatus Peregrinibacteria bacterium CG_4_10_14_0_2_um_filter_38_24]|nr:MAG: dephospho-CoA kinase [Candidatus Peregrinibacteria bacterium CG_4_10_14_0_2_um_filter_38_24]PJC38600.1 MAG: dephospho-CoA kinase [Candidatus Peregrinibacteria bacterium CG_4_9_14_0_2_um_filter_38_9]
MIIWLTGGQGSGKSLVMKFLKEKGFSCIYADKIVHELYKSGNDGETLIVKNFGERFLNKQGNVCRMKLKKLALENVKNIERLNKLMHPLVYKKIIELIDKYLASGKENIVIEAVYFDEKKFGKIVNKVIWVERENRKKEFSIKNPSRVDDVLKNNGSIADLKKSVYYLVR